MIASVKGCRDSWCKLVIVLPGTDVTGFIKQDRIWGVYPNEKLD